MQLERGQIHSLLLKVGKKLYKYLNGIAASEIEATFPRLKEVSSDCKTNRGYFCVPLLSNLQSLIFEYMIHD